MEPFSSCASCDIKCMNSRLLFRLLSSILSVFFMTAFCRGTFAELAPHRWFGLWHILIAWNHGFSSLVCEELHNACAIQCTNKRLFQRPQMTQETDTRKGLHLPKHPLPSMCLPCRACPYSEGWWSSESRSGNPPTIWRHMDLCCYLVHFILVWFIFRS